MNHTYRLVWKEAAQRYVPAAESARSRGKPGGCRALKPLRAILLAAAFGGAYVGSVDAAPTGGTVVAGQGTISQTSSTTTVHQQSQNLSLNWLGFSISPTETVQFVQPSTTAIALNRVIGTDASQIYGHLVANGQVFLINPNGVLFAPGAQVDVGSLVASTLNISNADFLAGNYKFQTGSSSSASSATPASVINQGSITAAAGGLVALLGGQVSNQGTITAQLGTVALAAGSAMTLDFRGNKLMSVQVDQSAVGALAENRQLIQADGGMVIMTAAARDALLNTVVNNTGVIEARTIQNQDGEIKLLGSSDGGRVNVDGTLDASAPSGGNGGSIETSGAHVDIADTAHITTAAPTGKTGTWLVDPTDFTIAPSGGDMTGATLSGELATTNVALASTSGSVSGNGDIFVNDAVSWSANTTLTLTAVRNINVNAAITNTASPSGGGVTLRADSAGACLTGAAASACGTVTFSGSGHITAANVNLYYNPAGSNYATPTDYSANVTGTLNAYMLVNDVTELQAINTNLGGSYALGTNIDASATSGWNSGAGFAPLGSFSAAFTGVFDGLNQTITGLTINRPSHPYVGLFSNNSGTIRNIGLSGGSVTGSVDVGALVGYNTGTIYNSYATTSVASTSSQVGGLVGETDVGSISNSYATGTVSGTNYVGGLVGYMPIGGAISGSYASGKVTATGNEVGGLVGYMSTNSVTYPSITNSYATGTVAGSVAVGGSTDVGGLVGDLVNGSITNSYSTGAVTGTTAVGGLVGTSASGTTITNSFWNITTSGLSTSSGGTGMTTAQMQSLANFTSATAANGSVNPNWDFTSVWRIYDGYTAPLLKALLTPLTVTADNTSVTYNGTTSTATLTNPVYSIAGADTSGHLQGITTPYANARNVGTYSPVLWSDQQGYDITVNNSTLTITPATLTITAASNTKTYDGTVTAAATPTFSGLQTGDTITGLTEAYADKNAGTGKTLSVTGYALSDSNGGNNYTVNTVANATGEIDKASLTLTSVSNTKTYDGTATAAATPTYSGLQTGDIITGLTEIYGDKNAGTGKTLYVSNFDISDSNGSNNIPNYTVNFVDSGTGAINKANLTITAASSTKTYDGTVTAAATPTYSGLQSGDTIAGLTEAYSDKNAGTGKTLSVTGYTVGDSNGGNNYTVSTVADTTGVIDKAALTITAASNTKTYDGTVTAAATPTYSGLQSGDTITGLTEAYSDKNAGTGKTLSVTGYIVGDSNGGNNYTVSTVSDTTGVIDKAALTITAASNTKTYDGAVTAAATPTYSGLQTGDTITGLTEAYTDKNAGTGKTLSVTGYMVSDANGGNNYTVSTVTDTTGVIDKANLTITAASNTKTYDGTVTAAATPTYSGLQTGDTITGLTEAYTDKNAGTGKTLSVTGYTVGDSNGGNNYTVSTVADTTGVIDKAALTITAAPNTKTYDGTATAAATPTYSGLQTGDTITGLTEAYADKNAGTGKTLSVTGYTVGDSNGGNNYTVSTVADTTGVIDKAALTITAAPNTKTYDGTVTAAATPAYSGLQTGDTITGLTEAYTDKNAGTGKTLSVTGYTVGDSNGGNNYTVSTVTDTTGVIDKATLTLTAISNTKTYDGTVTAAATPTYSGLQTGDTITGLTEAYTDKNAGTGKTLSVTGYTVGDSNGGNNYTVSTVTDTTGVIDKATLTLTAISNTKTYDGTVTAAATPTYSGLQTGDTITGLTEAYADKNAGTGKTLSVTGYTVGDSNGGNNYTVSTVTDTTGVIDKATLTLTAISNTKTYDGTVTAAATPTYSGLQTGDTITGLTEAYTDKNAGTGKTLSVTGYTVSDSNGGNNYTVSTVSDTTGVIDKAALTITAASNTKTYDGAVTAAATPTYSGLQTGDTITGLTEAYTDKNAGTGKTLSVTGYTVSDANGGNNYTVSTVTDTTGVIDKAALTITAAPNTKTYDGAVTATATPTYSGLQTGDSVSSLTEAYADKNAGTGKTLSVTGYTVTDSNGGNNYTVSTVTDTTGVIDKANLTLTSTSNTKTYDGTTTAAGGAVTASGNVAGDTVSASEAYTSKNVMGTDGSTLQVTHYSVTDTSGADMSGNYNVTTTTAAGTINPATITVSGATAANKTYDGSLDATISGGVLNGVFSGDSIGLLQTGLFTDRNAGTNKTVTEDFSLTGSDSGNYALAQGTGQTTATITPKTLTVIANALTKTYGQVDPTLSYTSSGYVSGTFNGVTVNDTAASVLTGTLTRAAGETVHGGPYTIRQGSLASNGNYTINYTPNFLTITPATITLSGITANDKPYDATTTATLNTAAASLVGRIGSDSLSVTATGDFVNSSAGTEKTVAISNLTLTGAASGNYVLAASGNESSTTANITPDNLTITADNATKVAGATNPALTLTYSGFVGGESASALTTRPTVSTTAATTSTAGNYQITASGAVDPNYTFTYVPGTLTVLGNAATSSQNYTGTLSNLSNVGTNGTSGSGSGVGEGEPHGAALDCSGYVYCVEIPGYLVDKDGEEDMRGKSKGALSLWSLIILDRGINLPVGAP